MPIPAFLSPTDDGIVVDTFVQPRAARTAVAGIHGSALKIKVAAPPIEGRANDALCEFLAELLDVPRSRVAVSSGASSRHKRVRISGVTMTVAARILGPDG
jgi:uncharacterized protein